MPKREYSLFLLSINKNSEYIEIANEHKIKIIRIE